jgi:methionyl-tRNA formyltransferase
MSASSPLAVGILSDRYLLEWQRRAVERLRAEPNVDVSLVVIDDESAETDDAEGYRDTRRRIGPGDVVRFFDFLRRRNAWALVTAERRLFWQLGATEPLGHRHDVAAVDCLDDVERIRCSPPSADGWTEFPDDVVERVADRCDVVVRFGFGLVRGRILTEPAHGVLSYHPADIRRYRGLGPELVFADGRDRAGVTLQRLSEVVDGGEIVAYDEISTDGCYTMWDLLEAIRERQIHLLVEGIANLRDPAFEPTILPEERLGEFYYRAHRETLSFSSRILAKHLTGRLRRRIP